MAKEDLNSIKQKLDTGAERTWCPGCLNFMILEAVKQTIAELILSKKYKQEDFAITTDIGCHAKMFDYLNLSGIYGLHGRGLPAAIGISLGNPNLRVLSFVGDGAIYAEGISHFIHAFKANPDMTLIVHDNQAFSLTTGQPTPTTEQGFKSKANPLGVKDKPLNPILLALASNATFIARTNAKDINHMKEILKKAIAHKGFSYVEVMQDCLIFNPEANNKKGIYKIPDNTDLKKAWALAQEYDYNTKTGKLPIGIIYQTREPTLAEKWPQFKRMLKSS